jgi:hypothetical protein
MKNSTKLQQSRQFFQTRTDPGIYAYRGFEIWKDAYRELWVINGPKGGAFRYLKEAKQHIDWIIKYPSKKPLVKPEPDV